MRGYDYAVLNELLLQLLTIIYSENSSILNYLFEEYFSKSVFELLDRGGADDWACLLFATSTTEEHTTRTCSGRSLALTRHTLGCSPLY